MSRQSGHVYWLQKHIGIFSCAIFSFPVGCVNGCVKPTRLMRSWVSKAGISITKSLPRNTKHCMLLGSMFSTQFWRKTGASLTAKLQLRAAGHDVIIITITLSLATLTITCIVNLLLCKFTNKWFNNNNNNNDNNNNTFNLYSAFSHLGCYNIIFHYSL